MERSFLFATAADSLLDSMMVRTADVEVPLAVISRMHAAATFGQLVNGSTVQRRATVERLLQKDSALIQRFLRG